MIIVLVLIAVFLIVAAMRDTQGDLFTALVSDVKAFGTWGAAVIAIALLGFVPGIKPVSRALLVLVIIVLFVNNYQSIITGLNEIWNRESKGDE